MSKGEDDLNGGDTTLFISQADYYAWYGCCSIHLDIACRSNTHIHTCVHTCIHRQQTMLDTWKSVSQFKCRPLFTLQHYSSPIRIGSSKRQKETSCFYLRLNYGHIESISQEFHRSFTFYDGFYFLPFLQLEYFPSDWIWCYNNSQKKTCLAIHLLSPNYLFAHTAH